MKCLSCEAEVDGLMCHTCRQSFEEACTAITTSAKAAAVSMNGVVQRIEALQKSLSDRLERTLAATNANGLLQCELCGWEDNTDCDCGIPGTRTKPDEPGLLKWPCEKKKKVIIPCTSCNGSGRAPNMKWASCSTCSGHGIVEQDASFRAVKCGTCCGCGRMKHYTSGHKQVKPCEVCNGSSWVWVYTGRGFVKPVKTKEGELPPLTKGLAIDCALPLDERE